MITRREQLDAGKERLAAVEAIVRADPGVNATDIARQIGVTKQRVYQILVELGYERVWRKRKRSRAG